jgi:hypothetical protein
MYQITLKCILPDNIVHPTGPIDSASILGDDGTIENQIFELFVKAGMYEDSVQFDDLLVDIGNNMLLQTPAIWSPQLNSVVRYAWNNQDLYSPAIDEFKQTHTAQVIELEKLGCKMNEIVVTETDLDVYELVRLRREDFDVDKFLSLMPSYVLETSTLVAEYYTKEISRNLEEKKN